MEPQTLPLGTQPPRPPMEKSPVVIVQQSNFHCNIRRFVLGLHTSGKANIGGMAVLVAMPTVALDGDCYHPRRPG